MADNDKKVTFELKELSYDELIDSYLEVLDFLGFLDETKLNVKAKSITGEKVEGEGTSENGEGKETAVELDTNDTPEKEESK